MKNNKYKVLDLFAGCGGLSKGLESTNRFEIVAANEIWPPAQDTYEMNHPETKLVKGDITKKKIKNQILDLFSDIKCDVIVGGPPCQAYSISGSRNLDDPRGKLFEEYVEIVARLNPEIFVMENVKGILTMKHEKEVLSDGELNELNLIKELENQRRELLLLRKRHKNNSEKFRFTDEDADRIHSLKKEIEQLKKSGSNLFEPVVDIIIRRFHQTGYEVKFMLLNSADYGVPQKRERVIFIGVKDEIPIKFPEPTHFKPNGTPALFENSNWVTVRETIDQLKDLEEDENWNHIFTTHSEKFTDKIKKTPVGKSVFGGYSDSFYRNPPDEPSRTVKENHGGVLVHYEKDRVMTPRELARLQSFEDDFIFKGSKSQTLVQIGNAVPPLLGKAVGESVAEMLDAHTLEKTQRPLVNKTGV
ncbi:MAG: DNA cytosine methyltransferase [Pyrinomonadaceae bacterium]